jgi:hypothetical protein
MWLPLFLSDALGYPNIKTGNIRKGLFFWFKRVPDRGPEQRESNLTVFCPLIIKILISYIIIYHVIIKLLIMENHPSPNRNSEKACCPE